MIRWYAICRCHRLDIHELALCDTPLNGSLNEWIILQKFGEISTFQWIIEWILQKFGEIFFFILERHGDCAMVRAPLCGGPIVNSLYIRWRSLVWSIYSPPPLPWPNLAHTHRVPISVTDIDRRKDRQTQQLNSIPLSSFSKIGFFKVNKKNFLMGTPKTKANAS